MNNTISFEAHILSHGCKNYFGNKKIFYIKKTNFIFFHIMLKKKDNVGQTSYRCKL